MADFSAERTEPDPFEIVNKGKVPKKGEHVEPLPAPNGEVYDEDKRVKEVKMKKKVYDTDKDIMKRKGS